eukprot:841620-Amphidinium_carterae.1
MYLASLSIDEALSLPLAAAFRPSAGQKLTVLCADTLVEAGKVMVAACTTGASRRATKKILAELSTEDDGADVSDTASQTGGAPMAVTAAGLAAAYATAQ